ncbi:MAG TPA: G1 family glutamic endopeptidase, partial [Candidatus Saccharimonadales bacterium]|nr:G1 family glutamic endopeptidase [Candidatus Saccharimonadales bacterium]
YTSVTSIWRVPTVTASAKATYSSSWVGIDGFNNRNLIQTGTEQDYYGGSAHYSAWWEILPAAGMVISSLTIHPGDTMSATIARNPTGGTWRITLTDRTTGKTFSTVRTYHGTGSSAEWIQEAPMVGGSVATLAHDSLTTFVGTANGGYPQLVASNRGTMVQNGVRVSTPSVPDRRTHGFSVRYAG